MPKPSPSSFVHPCVTPLSSVLSAPVVMPEVDGAFYAQARADVTLVKVAEAMRQRAYKIVRNCSRTADAHAPCRCTWRIHNDRSACVRTHTHAHAGCEMRACPRASAAASHDSSHSQGLIESPEDDWDAPVRVHTESLGSALGMDWAKYAASTVTDGPVAEHRLRQKTKQQQQLEAAVGELTSEAGDSEDETRGAVATGGGGGGSTARSSTPSTTTRKERKIIYTRDGRAVDNTVRSADEMALLERVQGHSTLAPPSTTHPSLARYKMDDGTSLIGTDGPKRADARAISAAAPASREALVPKWQVEKEIEEKRRKVRATLCHSSLPRTRGQ